MLEDARIGLKVDVDTLRGTVKYTLSRPGYNTACINCTFFKF
jgi:hypothetical protein